MPPRSIKVDDAFDRQPIGNKSLIPRKAFEAVGGFDPRMKASEDYDLYARLLLSRPGSRGRSVWRALHTKHGSHGLDRITDSRKGPGKRQFYFKHRANMTLLQRLHFIRFIMDRRAAFNTPISAIVLLKRARLKIIQRFRRLFVSVTERW